MEAGVYLYGIIRNDRPLAVAAQAVLSPSPVTQLDVDGFAVLVSPFAGGDIDPTRRNMLAHMRVQEEVMADRTLLPLRFGTVVPSTDRAVDLLRLNRQALAQAFARLDGRVELGLKVSWKDRSVFTRILDRTPAIKAMRDRIAALPPGQGYMDRIELGTAVETVLNQWREQEAARIEGRLAPLAVETARGEPLDELMVLNMAMLVERDREPAMDAAIDALGSEAEDTLDIKYVGPVPPYTFLDLKLVGQE